ncbi:MAG: ATP-binding cassette domain-containing protein [Acidimicrobiales bacterium]
MAAIEVRELRKQYGAIEAVQGVSFDVQAGEVFALLGPNGAGKSTTVEILEGHREPTSGTASVLGLDPAVAGRELRDRIGIVLQSSGIEDELTVLEALDLYSCGYSNPRDPQDVLNLVGLSGEGDRRVKKLSGGQQRRIDLALGLVGDPEVLFLDEPTTGFDPAARRKSWELIAGLRSLGTTIMLTTHYMEEAEYLADRVAVIVDGQIVAEGTPDDLMESSGRTVVMFRVKPDDSLDGIPLDDVELRGTEVRATTDEPTRTLHEVTGWALEQGIELLDLSARRPSLEDVYLQLAYPDVDDGDSSHSAAAAVASSVSSDDDHEGGG